MAVGKYKKGRSTGARKTPRSGTGKIVKGGIRAAIKAAAKKHKSKKKK